jgi:hypothetical protein
MRYFVSVVVILVSLGCVAAENKSLDIDKVFNVTLYDNNKVIGEYTADRFEVFDNTLVWYNGRKANSYKGKFLVIER